MASEPLSTSTSAAQTAFRLNRLADYLHEHAIRGIDGHDSEGVVEQNFSDSNGDKLSTRTIVIGALQANERIRIVLPTTGSPIFVPTTSAIRHSFHGVKFLTPDDMDLAINFVDKKILADSNLTSDEKTAMSTAIHHIKFQTTTYVEVVTVRGQNYAINVETDLSSGLIQLDYTRS